MRQVIYRDKDNYEWRVELPDGADDKDADKGIPLGPPDVRELGLPDDLARRLHGALVSQGLFTYNDVMRAGGMRAIFSAWQSVLQVDASSIMSLYIHPITESPKHNGHH
jgi:hypothetical protein